MQSICCKSIDLSTHDLTQRSTPELARLRICIISFNSRPHAEVDFPRLWGHRRWRPFNSRPHAEVDNRGIQRSVEGFFLSTHDLTQRSTGIRAYVSDNSCLSTHDLTQRSTEPASPQGIDVILSTHDLTQRSTSAILDSPSPEGSFNSRPHAEVDFHAIYYCSCFHLSTHDLTQRSTFTGTTFCNYGKPFNSRPHAEVDVSEMVTFNGAMTFQLTTSRRGRRMTWDGRRYGLIFQLTTSRRGRHSLPGSLPPFRNFQLTTSRRGRLGKPAVFARGITFQLTTSRRGRPVNQQIADMQTAFNSRPHAEVDTM